MVSKIDRLTMDKIVAQVGFPYNINELRNAYRYNVDVQVAMEFEKQIKMSKNFKDIARIMLQYENIFDKNIYVLHIGRLLEKDLKLQRRHEILAEETEELPKRQVLVNDSKGIGIRRFIVNAKELLKGVQVADLGVNSSTGDIVVYTSKEFVDENFSGKKRKARAEEKLEIIEEKLGFSNVLRFLSPSDLIEVCEYPNLGNILAVRLYKDKNDVKGKKIEGQNNKSSNSNVVDDEILENANVFDWNEFEETVRKYIAYIDIDKMLLLANSVYYNKHGNEFEKFDAEDAGNLQDFTEKVGEIIDVKKTKVVSPRFLTEVDYKLISSSVAALNQHFINGKYYEFSEITKLIEDITNGLVPISNISKREYQNILQLTVEELSILDRNNPEALQYLVKNGMLEENEIEDVLRLKQKYTDEQALYFVGSGIMSNDYILELYNSGILTLENVKHVKMNLEGRDLNDIVSTDKLVELYLNPEKSAEFEKYRKLYKLLIIDESRAEAIERESKKDDKVAIKELDRRILNRRKAIGISILDKSVDLLTDEYMYDLYHKGILQIDTVVDYMGYDAVSKLYASGELKPSDAKRLFNEKILTEAMLTELFKSDDLNETQKLVLIYSTFPSDEEKDVKLRNKFMSYMSGPVNVISESTGDKKGPKGEESENQNKYITDPCARWNLISSLDKDYSQEYLRDGHIVFYLPNQGKYVIEKLYDKNNKPAYGAATYVLDEVVFKVHETDILNDRVINKTALVSLNKAKVQGVKKLVHTSWGNSILKFFDIENPQKYTEEEKIEIKKQAERVEKSKKPMTRDDD